MTVALREWSRLAASAALAIVGSGARDATIWLHFIFKPLTTILIFVSAWRIKNPVSARYRKAVLTGIGFSLAGDIFLMLPKTVLSPGFILGLVSFLIAHLLFLWAFFSDSRLKASPLVRLVYVAVALANLAVLWPGLPAALQAPVVAYMAALVMMSSQAMLRYLSLRTASSKLAAIGGILFMASDTILAYNKFYAPVPAAPLFILATYYTALFLIARSVAESAPQK